MSMQWMEWSGELYYHTVEYMYNCICIERCAIKWTVNLLIDYKSRPLKNDWISATFQTQ